MNDEICLFTEQGLEAMTNTLATVRDMHADLGVVLQNAEFAVEPQSDMAPFRFRVVRNARTAEYMIAVLER